jgi:hypothetical protein
MPRDQASLIPGVSGRISLRPVARMTFRLVYVWPELSVVRKDEPLFWETIEVAFLNLIWAVGYLEICSRAKALNFSGAVPVIKH